MATCLHATLRRRPVTADWHGVHLPDVPMLLLTREPPLPEATLLALGPIDIRLSIRPAEAAAALRSEGLRPTLAADIADLARRFAGLTGVETVRIRLERIENDACRRFHADYTDIRLVTTYAGPGTEVRESTAADAPVRRMRAGEIGLFKGRLYPGEPPVLLHRSPPLAGSGRARLVLVIDTPERD